MKVLVTGSAGFIGFHLVSRLIRENVHEIVGLDNINSYYDVRLKYGRLNENGISSDSIPHNVPVSSSITPNYRFIKLNLEDRREILELFEREQFDWVCHLAAQAGVRYSLENPYAYIDGNISGFLNILEGCRHFGVRHLVYASSSSVFGLNEEMPFRISHNVDHPVSIYAATKKSCELMAHSYSHLYRLPTTGLRFFTVYGPWGRPDMALFKFVGRMLKGEPIDIYNHGRMQRDFTYIDDIIEGLCRVLQQPQKENTPASTGSSAPYRLYNIGNGKPVRLTDFITAIEEALGIEAQKNLLPMQPGDVIATYADCSDLLRDFGYAPGINVKQGVKEFVDWFQTWTV